MERFVLTTKSSSDYELLDSGGEEKLERYGGALLTRPDPQALWSKHLSEAEWAKSDGRFVREGGEGRWNVKAELPKEWQISFGGLQFFIRPTSFKHTGLFPEQLPNWEWGRELIKNANRPISVLNLFGYTGGASLAAAQAGSSVVHVDASKTAVAWARQNAEASGLGDKPIRWIVEDALTFVKREIKRGNKYDAIIMDPPAFGHGPKDELWKIEEDFVAFVELCTQLLSDNPLFVLVNGYAAGYSSFAFAYNLDALNKKFGGKVEHGDLTIEEKTTGRLLPCGIFARWQRI
ncbi:class I SAM-dependent methyltransferase [Acetobacteraceae bacterium]|nr:class I SAM-dependent methyltransferase [Candidatus Parcubacteria bacterium]